MFFWFFLVFVFCFFFIITLDTGPGRRLSLDLSDATVVYESQVNRLFGVCEV